MKSNIIFLEL